MVRVGLFVLLGVAACGLAVTGSAPPDGHADPTADASHPPGVAQDAASSVDAKGSSDHDAGIDDAGNGCKVLIDDTFDAIHADWDQLGSILFTAGTVMLTHENAGAQAGAIWWKQPLTFAGHLHVVLDFSITSDNFTPGDGIALAWVSASVPYVLGQAWQNFGLCNADLSGVAVAADSKDAKLLLMNGVARDCATNNGVISADVTSATHMEMNVYVGSLDGSLGAVTGSRDITTTQTGYFGITASTGNGFSAHVVSAVKVSSCP